MPASAMLDFLSQIKGFSRDRLVLLAAELQQKLDQAKAARRQLAKENSPQGEVPGVGRQPHYDPFRSPSLPGRFADILALDALDPSHLQLQFDDEARRRLRESSPSGRWGRDVLVLGGNGFVGCHLVHRLLADKRVRRVRTLVRARHGIDPRERVLKSWDKYELPQASVELDRLTVLDGSPVVKRFGLPANDYNALASEVDAVFDCVGSIDYLRPYLDLRTDWVLELLGVLQFALDQRVKQVTYLGSVIAHLCENNVSIARSDTRWGAGYAQVKWVNHALITSAASAGMPAILCEAPHVFGSTTVGRDPAMQYGFWKILKLATMLRLSWDGVFPDFAPVDVLVDAMVDNALGAHPLPMIRPLAPWRIRTADMAPLAGCRVVTWEAFLAEVTKFASPGEMQILADAPEIIEQTNTQPVYPPGYDLSRFPEPQVLAELYLRQLELTPFSQNYTSNTEPTRVGVD